MILPKQPAWLIDRQGARAMPPRQHENNVAYIAEMAAVLAQMAREVDLETLAYLLEMAVLEAEGSQGNEPKR